MQSFASEGRFPWQGCHVTCLTPLGALLEASLVDLLAEVALELVVVALAGELEEARVKQDEAAKRLLL